MYFCDTLSATIIEMILWDFLMFYQIFLSPQVKQSAITGNELYKGYMSCLTSCRMIKTYNLRK